MMTIVFFFIRIHQFTLFSRRHPFIQDTTKKTNSVCCVQFKNNNECTCHVWRLLVSHHCLPSNNVPSSFVLCDENTIWWTFFTNVWIWGHTGKVLELKRLDRVILEDAFLGQRFNSVLELFSDGGCARQPLRTEPRQCVGGQPWACHGELQR